MSLMVAIFLIADHSLADAHAASLSVASCGKKADFKSGQAADPDTLYQIVSPQLRLKLNLAAGVRSDDLKWNIAGSPPTSSPNILSELEWSHVRSQQVRLGGRIQLKRSFYGRAYINYAWIQSGSVRDSDYDGDNRTQEYSRSISDTNGDHLWDIVAGFGYPLTFLKERFFAAPMVGVSFHRQSFRITNGRQVISEHSGTPAVGPLDSRLNSLYTADWRSLWIGCDLRYEMDAPPAKPSPMALELSLKYFFLADYSAEADWNLRGDLQHPVSFDQSADGRGISVQLKWLLHIVRQLYVSLNLDYSRWKTDPGDDVVHTATGPWQSTRLNEVCWESRSIMVEIMYRLF